MCGWLALIVTFMTITLIVLSSVVCRLWPLVVVSVRVVFVLWVVWLKLGDPGLRGKSVSCLTLLTATTLGAFLESVGSGRRCEILVFRRGLRLGSLEWCGVSFCRLGVARG